MKDVCPTNKKKDLISMIIDQTNEWSCAITIHKTNWILWSRVIITDRKTTDFDECITGENLKDIILEKYQRNKGLILFDVYPYYQMNVMI